MFVPGIKFFQLVTMVMDSKKVTNHWCFCTVCITLYMIYIFVILILSKGPLSCTLKDFWQMIWYHHCPIIVMITKLEERNEVNFIFSLFLLLLLLLLNNNIYLH